MQGTERGGWGGERYPLVSASLELTVWCLLHQLLVLYSTDLHVSLRQVLPVGITQNENLVLLRVHFIAVGILGHRHGAH